MGIKKDNKNLSKAILSLLFLYCLSFISWNKAYGKSKIEYMAYTIPDSLKENANAVYRLDQGVFKIQSINKATYYGKYAITILNSKGAHRASFNFDYDMYSSINYIKGSIYNNMGVEIKKIKKSDISDESISSFSLYDDNRVKKFKCFESTYPYTIEIEYEKEYDGFMFYPPWFFIPGYNVSVEQSYFEVIAPKDFDFRYKESFLSNEVKITRNEETTSYLWEAKNLTAIEDEPLSPSIKYFTPNIELAPNKFYFGGYEGDFTTWNDFSKWINLLMEERQELPEETINQLKELTKGLTDDTEKIKAVYEYLQSKTRYVSIQLGIGGFQPFLAETVDELYYGDCKALSNYTMALLKAIGIKANYTIVYSGNSHRMVSKEFPNHFANHAILMVPNKNDTLWLECTSQKLPFGYIHKRIANRPCLVMDDDGGKIVNIPGLEDSLSIQSRKITVNLNTDGSGNAISSTQFKGYLFENRFGLKDKDREDQKKWLYKNLHISNFALNDFAFIEDKDKDPIIYENLDIDLKNYATVTGNRLFVTLNLMNRSTYLPKELDERKTPIVLWSGYQHIDSVIYNIPDGYTIENVPTETKFESEFGIYSAIAKVKGNQILYVRKELLRKGTYPASSYNGFQELCKKIEKTDRLRAVLVKND